MCFQSRLFPFILKARQASKSDSHSSQALLWRNSSVFRFFHAPAPAPGALTCQRPWVTSPSPKGRVFPQGSDTFYRGFMVFWFFTLRMFWELYLFLLRICTN